MLRRSGLALIFCLTLASTPAEAGSGSPKAFEKYAGEYAGSGVFRDTLGNITLRQGEVTTEVGELEVASPPRSATLTLFSSVEFTNGSSSEINSLLTFSRKNRVTETLRFVGGLTGTMTTTYKIKRGRVTYEGDMIFTGGSILQAEVKGVLRFTDTQVRFTETITFGTGEVILIRQTLER